MIAAAILFIGFSLFSALALAISHFKVNHYAGQQTSRVMGLVLLAALSALQFAHFGWLYFDEEWTATLVYRMTLFAVAPAFYLFSQPLLRPESRSTFGPARLLHAAPILACTFVPGSVALPLAFIVGAGYLVWLGRSLYSLRRERMNFRVEISLLGAVFVIAVGVSLLAFAGPSLQGKLFTSLYACAIGCAFLLVQTTLGLRPQLATEVSEIAQTAYAHSTLSNIDRDAALATLNDLMSRDRLYENPDLNLPTLADKLRLTAHQLSELLNVHLCKGFSRYLREWRVGASKTLLVDEPSASVLSIGISVGFTSQSNFYEAFREIEGMTPGQYRRLNTPPKPD